MKKFTGKSMESMNVELMNDMARFQHDLLGFVLYSFPWGEGELRDYPGPSKWQVKWLNEISDRFKQNEVLGMMAVKKAIASGRGIGKSALVAWLILWTLCTFEESRGIVTANTEPQLKTKTWPELAVWYNRMICKHWFVYTATAIYSSNPKYEKTWRVDMSPWNQSRPESFAGLHNLGKRVLIIFDEASAIPKQIWEVAEGCLSDKDTEILWAVFGNPTRSGGSFFECFGSKRNAWHGEQIDARDADVTNKKQIQEWLDFYGEDHDWFRVHVRGMFPKAAATQYIDSETVRKSMTCEARALWGDPLILALDIARGGDDNCVFMFRRGFDARSVPIKVIPGAEVRDSMRLVSVALELIERYKPDAFFYDGTGVGGPVGDRVRQLGYRVQEVQFGGAAPDARYANMRAYMYMKAREWMMAGGAIPEDHELEMQLTNIEYGHDAKDRLLLEKKEHMKERGLPSPDHADALAMTFAFPVAAVSTPSVQGVSRPGIAFEYDPFAEGRS